MPRNSLYSTPYRDRNDHETIGACVRADKKAKSCASREVATRNGWVLQLIVCLGVGAFFLVWFLVAIYLWGK